ncbi:MAG: acyltransferase [Candidatus Koribacter versatilis]|uniref:Acyltransferase n=1 Tax=Candidatus Korobacter versatilis TaxID=658062 RepID=A0A932A9X5_9BACT|nr:acyltransferase [Candidatus Koribacter versatilis]
MPRYEYRNIQPTLAAEKAYSAWIAELDAAFSKRDPEHSANVVRNALHELYLGRRYAPPAAEMPLAQQAQVHSFDPRNASLEPEYYGDVDAQKYAERKPLIWFWMMYDRSPVGLNHWLGFRVRAMIAKHVLKHIGKNVKIFHGVEVSYGYNLSIEDDCTIHKYVLLDDRGEIVIHAGSSVSDYANVYSHAHDLNDGMIVDNVKTEIGPKARVTYHATVLSGVKVGEHGIVGSMGVASKDVENFHIVAGIPAKTVKVKSIAPEEAQRAFAEKKAAQKK